MNAAVEYISAGVIIFMILGVTGQYATDMVADRINRIEQSAILKKADNIVDTLLLSPGRPADWGELDPEPEMLGLSSENAIKLYLLDADKVSRLSSTSDNYIPPGTARDLLGLSANYYISIEIFPVFQITVEKLSDTKFSITVLNQWNKPVSNVHVTAAYTNTPVSYIRASDIILFMDRGLEGAIYTTNITDSLGRCTVHFTGPERASLIVCGKQFYVKSLVTWPINSEALIGYIESSMGSPSGFNAERVYRNVDIDGFTYVVRFTMWS